MKEDRRFTAILEIDNDEPNGLCEALVTRMLSWEVVGPPGGQRPGLRRQVQRGHAVGLPGLDSASRRRLATCPRQRWAPAARS